MFKRWGEDLGADQDDRETIRTSVAARISMMVRRWGESLGADQADREIIRTSVTAQFSTTQCASLQSSAGTIELADSRTQGSSVHNQPVVVDNVQHNPMHSDAEIQTPHPQVKQVELSKLSWLRPC